MGNRHTVVLLGIMLTSCTRGANRAQSQARSYDSAGVNIVETSSPQWETKGEGLDLTASELTVIPGDPDDLSYFFLFPRAVLRLEDGRILVADAGTSQLLFFDSTGRLQKAAGRKGEGPGEFISMFSVHKCRGDTIVVNEGQRVSIMDRSGSFVVSHPIVPEVLRAPRMIFGVSGDCAEGLILVPEFRNPVPGEGIHQLRQMLFWARFDGGGRDTVASFPGPDLFPWFRMGQLVSVKVPFGDGPVWASGGEYVYLGSSDTPEVRVLRRDGSLHRIIRWGVETERLAEQDIDAYAESYSQFLRYNPGEKNRYPAPSHFPQPAYKPLFSKFLADPAGYLWVLQYSGEDTFSPPANSESWWVFGPDGIWLDTVSLPPGMRLLGVQGRYLITSRDREDGVQDIVLLQMPRLPQ